MQSNKDIDNVRVVKMRMGKYFFEGHKKTGKDDRNSEI